MDLRPWDVARITFGSTPSSFPILIRVSEWPFTFLSQVIPLPVFDYRICRINNSAVHIKELKPRKLPSLYNHLPEVTY